MADKLIEVPDPIRVKAEDVQTPQDWYNTLNAASKNTVIMDGAHAHGFMADRVVVTPGITDRKLTPEQITNIVNSPHTPVLNQSMAAQALKYLHSAGALFGITPAQAGEVVKGPWQPKSEVDNIAPVTGPMPGGGGLPRANTPVNPGDVVQFGSKQSGMTDQDKYDAAVAKQQWDVGTPKFSGLADRWANFAKNDPKNAAMWEKEFHYALDKVSPENRAAIYMKIGKALDEYGY